MAHKVLIDGTAYEIKGGKTRVGGTAYAIKAGRTRVNATGYDISFSGVLRASCSIYVASGSDEYKVTISVNGKTYTQIYGSDGTPQTVDIPVSEGDEVEFLLAWNGYESVSIQSSNLSGCSELQTTYDSITLKLTAQEASADILFEIYN